MARRNASFLGGSAPPGPLSPRSASGAPAGPSRCGRRSQRAKRRCTPGRGLLGLEFEVVLGTAQFKFRTPETILH
eukprot:8656026-Alexandrium_andersonii.AAC.1